MQVSGPAFVRAVIDKLGLEDNPRQASRDPWLKGANALADELRLGSNGYQRVWRWLVGRSTPEYEPTLAMLDRCGWLTEEARRSLVEAEAARVASAAEAHADQGEGQAPPRRNKATG